MIRDNVRWPEGTWKKVFFQQMSVFATFIYETLNLLKHFCLDLFRKLNTFRSLTFSLRVNVLQATLLGVHPLCWRFAMYRLLVLGLYLPVLPLVLVISFISRPK